MKFQNFPEKQFWAKMLELALVEKFKQPIIGYLSVEERKEEGMQILKDCLLFADKLTELRRERE